MLAVHIFLIIYIFLYASIKKEKKICTRYDFAGVVGQSFRFVHFGVNTFCIIWNLKSNDKALRAFKNQFWSKTKLSFTKKKFVYDSFFTRGLFPTVFPYAFSKVLGKSINYPSELPPGVQNSISIVKRIIFFWSREKTRWLGGTEQKKKKKNPHN